QESSHAVGRDPRRASYGGDLSDDDDLRAVDGRQIALPRGGHRARAFGAGVRGARARSLGAGGGEYGLILRSFRIYPGRLEDCEDRSLGFQIGTMIWLVRSG